MPDLLKSLAGGSDNEACQPLPPPPPITGREGQDCPWDGGIGRGGARRQSNRALGAIIGLERH